jgi:hypothetical protein
MMNSKEVIPAFDILLEELDSIIPELNQQGAKLMENKKYNEARKIISKAELVIDFQRKLKDLREEWLRMAIPSTKKPPKKIKTRKRKTTKMLDAGLRTPNEAFHLPILQALVQLGGAGKVKDILDRVEEIMAGRLNKYDYDSIPSNPNIIRWRNNAQWARYTLVQEGYLADDSPRGVWEITDAGRERVNKESRNKNSVSENLERYQTVQGELKFTMDKVSFEPGKVYNRQEDLHDKFGGNRQSGIAPCAKAPIIFLFTSEKGDEFGYNDGWVSEEIYHYSGEGQTGDMELNHGNRAIRDHAEEGRELHLFKKVDSGRYEYIGQFEYLRHEIVEGLDAVQKHRGMIRFVLKSVKDS